MFSEEFHVHRTALIDADYIAYHTAAWAHSHQADMHDIHEKMLDALDLWIIMACASDAVMIFSCDKEDNFRRDSYPLYKAHRTGAPPAMLHETKDLLRSLPVQAVSRPRVEADDLIGVLMTNGRVKNPVCISRDKDLRQIPGWHLNPFEEDFPVHVSPYDADLKFYTQWLTGDTTDGFHGIRGIGPKKAMALLNPDRPDSWEETVCRTYQHYGFSVEQAEAQAVCARILRAEDWDAKRQAPRPYTIPEPLRWSPVYDTA